MAIYTIPPTRTRSIQDGINQMADVFESYADQIIDNMVTNALSNVGLPTLKVSKASIIKLINYIVVPQMQSWEAGWVDNPSTPSNPSMQGISLRTFVENFNFVFTYSGIQPVTQAANEWNATYPAWGLEPEFSKVVLSLVCGRPKIASLFIYYVFCNSGARNPIAVMTEDPWLGFFLGQSVWSSGANVYSTYVCDYDSVALDYGWNGLDSAWMSFITSLGDLTTNFALDCFLKRYNYIMKVSKPEGSNANYRTAWLDRLANSEKSDLLMIINITENFCLNSKNIYTFTSSETLHLQQKAANYKQMQLILPD